VKSPTKLPSLNRSEKALADQGLVRWFTAKTAKAAFSASQSCKHAELYDTADAATANAAYLGLCAAA